MEAVITADILRRAEILVTIASIDDSDVVLCRRGVRLYPDQGLTEASKDKVYDAVIMPGGIKGSLALAQSIAVGAVLKKQFNDNRLVAAICAAPTVFKVHGIGKGKKVTCFPPLKDQMKDDYVHIDERVVVDGNLLTSQGPATAHLFGLAIVEKLVGKAVAKSVAEGMLCADYN